MARALGFSGARAKTARLVDATLQATADRGTEIAVQTHREAPRGGTYLNMYGQPRSAVGEQPAEETGKLMSILEMPPSPVPGGYSIPVNYRWLEATRPMGLMISLRLKAEVESGGPIKPRHS